jgi:3-hydroxybutyryl-CoA dehydrogenase
VGVIGVLDALDGHYRGERYRASSWLRRRRDRLAVPG